MISIIIPVYDRKKLLVESLWSIINQKNIRFEIRIICDGSPKETMDIVKQFESNFSNVYGYYYPDNSGNAIRSRNKGILEAEGEFIAFQDSDDVAESRRLEWSLKAITKYEVDLVYGGWRAIVDGSRETNIRDGQKFLPRDCDLNILKKHNPICQSTVMARTEVLRKVGGFNPKMKYREDHELWLRMAYRGYKFKAIRRILTNLRLHSGNLELKYKEDDDYWYDLMLQLYQEEISL